MSSASPPTGQNASAPKHRACDECRTRKLACTKESDGCSRCKREAIPCHYSPQKQMGRPRKRPRDESSNDNPIPAPPTKNVMTEIPPDTTDPGMDFINLLIGDSAFDPMVPMDTVDYDQPQQQGKGHAWNFGYTGDAFGDVNFDAMPDQAQSFSPSNIDPALFTSEPPPPAEQVPELSPNSASTPESSTSTNGPAQNCACTASLYLGLDSMQKLSSEVETAIRQARTAAKTAYEVVNCPTCSFKVEPPGPTTQHMNNFQNLMLLAALIPSIVHAYERILEVVDQETNRAVAERRQIIFKLHGLGGTWGPISSNDTCGVSKAFHHREMEPAMWRLIVRALLKLDVYGLSGGCTDGGPSHGDPFHLGLKDIVLQMETKSKSRHALMDAMIDSGAWKDPKCALKLHKDGEQPTCQRIISIARASVEQLVIA